MHVFNDLGVIWMCNVSHTYCCNGPAASVLTAVDIRRMILKMLFVFLFSETLDQQMNCEITNAANEDFRAQCAFCVFENLPCGT